MPRPKLTPFPWPFGGVVENSAESGQPSGTSPDALNVRSYDALGRRNRGGQRSGLSRFIDSQPNGTNSIQLLIPGVEAVPLSTEAAIGSKYADPSNSIFVQNEGDVEFHPSGDWVLFGASSSPRLRIYPWTNASGFGNALSNPSTLPTGDVEGLSWHPGGEYIASAQGGGGLHFYEFDTSGNGAFGSKLSNPSDEPNDDAFDVDWHPDGEYVAAAMAGDTVYIWPFDSSGNSFDTAITITASANVRTVAWSPDGTVLMVGLTGSPYLEAYPFTPSTGSVGSKYSDPNTLPLNTTTDISWHPDQSYVAVAAEGQFDHANVWPWDNTTGFGAKVANPGTTDQVASRVRFSPNGNFLLVGLKNTSPYLRVYPWSGGFGTILSAPSTGAGGSVWGVDWHPSTEAFAAVHENDGYMDAWQFTPTDTNPSARVNRLIAVSGGNIYYTDADVSQFLIGSGGSGITQSTGIVRGAVASQKVFFCDGKADSYHYLDLSDKIVKDWSSDVTAGSLPVGSSDASVACRIIAVYRGRVVLSGLQEDPQNWFMSRSGDPFDWDYSPSTPSATQPVAGNNASAGKVGDIVTALAPYQDDIMVMGGSNTLWMMRGDPAAGGQIDNISRNIGVVGPEAWAYDNSGNFFFFGVNGLYILPVGGAAPELLSKNRLDATFKDIDVSSNNIRLVYDPTWQGIHIFVQPFNKPSTAPLHYWWDQRNDAFWLDQYPVDHGPASMVYFNSDNPENSGVLIGGWDGYVRRFNPDENQDDGTDIDSRVLFAPDQPGQLPSSTRWDDLWFSLAEGSDDVTLKLFSGNTPEAARDNADADTPVVARTLKGGRNTPLLQRIAQNTLIVQLSQSGNGADGGTWAYEQGIAKATVLDRMRGRHPS